jgi:hypothetical protein
MFNLTEDEQNAYDSFLKTFSDIIASDHQILLYLLAKQQVKIKQLELTLYVNGIYL